MAKVPVALQLFSVRGEVEKDLPSTLKSVADLGYVGAEPWGYGGEDLTWMGHSCQDIKKMYEDNGLVCCGIHLQPGALVGDNLKRTVEFNQVLGNRFLVIAGDKERMSTMDGVKDLANTLNQAAEALEPEDMFPGYHAHPFDFVDVGGREAWDVLFSETGERVIMQVDIGNSMAGGGDPIHYLKKFPGRARTVHIKEFGGPQGAVIGEGDVDWPTVFDLCENQHPIEWYVVEEGGPEGLGFDVCRRSLEALKRMGKA